MAEALVVARDVSRTFAQGVGLLALDSISCRIEAADRIAIVGPSGSGKSTLLHILGGLDFPTTGAVEWPALGGREQLRPRKIAFVFQVPSLVPELSAVENVELPLLLAGVSRATSRSMAMAALERIDLGFLGSKLPEELSAGQAQRVGMARAVALKPQLVLADEPTGQLDQPTAMRLVDALFAALEGTYAALVVATHDRTLAARLPTVWTIKHGKLQVTRNAC